MDSLIAGAEEVLIDTLNFSLPKTAGYITERKFSTFQTEGSNAYSAVSGTKIIRFRLASEGWLDPSTVRFFFDVVNTDGTPGTKLLRPLGKCHAFFRRFRALVRGVVVEDIFDYNRVSEMFDILKNPASYKNEQCESFNLNDDITEIAKLKDEVGTLDIAMPAIGATSLTVCFKPLSGLFMQSKYINLKYCPIELEFELCSNSTDPVISVNNTAFPNASTSTSWRIENCMIKADVVQIDNSLQNKYEEHLLSAGGLKIPYLTFISNLQTITSAKGQINVSRSVSKLKAMYLTLDKTLGTKRSTWYNKQWNNFYNPICGGDEVNAKPVYNSANDILNLQLQVGSKLYPDYPIRSSQEAYYQLVKTLGIGASSIHGINISPIAYQNNRFVTAIDLEKTLHVPFTGTDTHNSIMTVKLETLDANKPDALHCVMVCENVLEINYAAVSVYD